MDTSAGSGRAVRRAHHIQRGWLVLVAGFDGDDATWLQVASVKTCDKGTRLFFVNGEISLLLPVGAECTTTGLHKAA